MDKQIKPCPHCQKSWMYVSDGDYYSDYESKGYRINCRCGYAWKTISWQPTREEAIDLWNRRANNG